MQGCMAHVRTDEREATVIGFVTRNVYGSSIPVTYAQLQYDGGEVVERAAEARLWNEYEGLPEYQE